ncbi:hypothetical protein Tco_1211284 [Tanacetum coccineum]
MAQNVIPADQLVSQVKPIRRCNNYAVLQSIPCSPECKIVGQLLLDHPLSYTLTATADVPAVYLQLFWRTVTKVPNTKDTIKFMLDTQQIAYIVDMVGYQGVVDKVSAFYTKYLAQPWQTIFKVFNRCLTTRTSGHDQTKINILQLFHVVVNRTNVDYAALLWWDIMANVFQKKEALQYPRFIKLIIVDVMMKFPNIPKRLEEDYHSIKDYIPLISVYTTRNFLVRGMLIPDAFLTNEIRETNDFKDCEAVFLKVDVLMKQLQPIFSTQGTNRGIPRALRSPTVSASPQEKKKRKQITGESSSPRKSLKVIIKQKQVVEEEKDDDNSEDRLEPRSHKENPEVVDDDDDNE